MKWPPLILSAIAPAISLAQSVQAPTSDTSPEAEMATFSVHPDFEVSLYADESMGIANPIAIHWDSKGRLWVLTTLAYAQLAPGETPNDTLVVLEDTDGDHRADQSTVFADGLDMPMGFAILPEENGVYLGEGPDLLKLVDTTGDGKADTRERVLTGFGTGDTHQNISNFIWGPNGNLWFSQGLHCFSRVETPWGIERGDAAGFWKFEPDQIRLTPYCFPSMASQNPCGMVFDETGALFVKSNNRELIYATPGLVPTMHPLNLLRIGNLGATPGKSMGGEFANHATHPDWLRRTILIAGYYSHRVTAFPLVEDGAGYRKVEPLEVMASSHESFRPVDIRIGPDEAVYVVDWFNPIIGHYQASLRHPDRDKKHGRIWRLVPKKTNAHPVAPMTKTPMRERLDQVIAAANSDSGNALAAALEALDKPVDRHLNHALVQTVHAKADQLSSIEDLDHLAFAIEALSTPAAAEIARARADDPRFQKVLARVGTGKDRRDLLASPEVAIDVLNALADGNGRAIPPFEDSLRRLLGDPTRAATAARLAGRWKVKILTDDLARLAQSDETPAPLRKQSLVAWAQVAGPSVTGALAKIADQSGSDLLPQALEALATADLAAAARFVARQDAQKVTEHPDALVRPFLMRKNGLTALANALESANLDAESARALAGTLAKLGRSDEALTTVLDRAQGIAATDQPYSPELVAAIASRVRTIGDAGKGEKIFQRAELACVACHQIDEKGGVIGPSLDTVGAGLPLSILIESILWPNRQLKEGYFAETITETGGRVYTGYVQRESGGTVWIRDTAMAMERLVLQNQIKSRQNVGSLMPAGLTKSLSDEELAHLVKYLAERK